MVLICWKLKPIHQRMLWAKFRWNWPSSSGGDFRYLVVIFPWRRWKCEKFTDRPTHGQQTIRKVHLSFQLRWDKNQTNTVYLWQLLNLLLLPLIDTLIKQLFLIELYTYINNWNDKDTYIILINIIYNHIE